VVLRGRGFCRRRPPDFNVPNLGAGVPNPSA